MRKPIRLMLVDDHDIVRMGLKSFLETQEGLIVVAEAGNGEQAISRFAETHPDVVVMDISMPGMDGLEATRRLKSLDPACRILALTIHEDRQYFFEMLAAGASGYVTKHVASDELVAGVRAVAAGHVYLQPALAHWLLEDYRRLQTLSGEQGAANAHGRPKAQATLSQRELQVLELVAQGLTTPQISKQLGISPKTVTRHRERIMARLSLHSSAELVKYAIRTGLIMA